MNISTMYTTERETPTKSDDWMALLLKLTAKDAEDVEFPDDGDPVDWSSDTDESDQVPVIFKPSELLESQPRHKCGECKKSFRKEFSLAKHLRSHVGETPSQDNGKEVRHRSVLLRRRERDREELYPCKGCKETFFGKAALNRHVQQFHSPFRPFQCDICHKKFTTKAVLVKHGRIHIGAKPHQCEFCKRCFTEKANMVAHRRMHTGERPHQCDFCGKSFQRKWALSDHRQKVHGSMEGSPPFVCKGCSVHFSSYYEYSLHQRTNCEKSIAKPCVVLVEKIKIPQWQ